MENARLLNELRQRTTDLQECIPDGDERRVEGHQPLDLRFATGLGHACRNRGASVVPTAHIVTRDGGGDPDSGNLRL